MGNLRGWSTSKRFFTGFKELGIGVCWQWMRCLSPKGYGKIFDRGKHKRAHRISWEIYHGPIPSNLLVCHTCDNPSCVNPNHLFLGTQKDNRVDCSTKGRTFNQKKTQCKRGHKFTPKNTHLSKNGRRKCRMCDSIFRKKGAYVRVTDR